MEILKKIFYTLIIIVIFYLQWFFRFFMFEVTKLVNPQDPTMSRGSTILPILNISLQILLIVYLIINWRHFKKWNKKFSNLKDLEKIIYEELGLENGDYNEDCPRFLSACPIDFIEKSLI